MVAIHYDFQKDSPSYIGEIRKPKENYLIPVVFLICLTGTFALTILYFYQNEEMFSLKIRTSNAVSKRLVCYYNFPSSTADLQPKNIDPFLCSHIIVGFLSVNGTYELDFNDAQVEALKEVNDLKSQNPHLKVLISVGGAGNTKGWPEMVLNHVNRKRFIKSTRIFLKQHELDGIDLDWEYPNELGVNDKERIHFTQLLEEFRSHIDRNSYKFLLSVAVPSSSFRVDTSYQVNYLNQYTDFINLMSYDFHFFSNLTPFTGLNSPLVKSSMDNGIFASMNINDTINFYEGKGMDRTKMNIGLPTYGHTFTIMLNANTSLSIKLSIFTLLALKSVLSSPLVTINVPSSESKRVVCYYTFPTTSYTLKPEDVDPKICTHILVGFVSLTNSSIDITKDQKDVIKRVVNLKKKKSDLKVMLSIGGGGGDFGFPEMVSSPKNRSKFIQSIEYTVANLDLDGIDLDWEFPNNLLKNDKGNLIDLLEEIRENINNSVRTYLISIAVAAPITIVEASYDVPEIDKFVDFVNLMSYDYNFFSFLTPWTGMNAPLYARSNDVFYFKTQNINYTSNYWVKKGMSKKKLNIGLPVYAHTYKLSSPNKTYLGAPAVGDGVLGGAGSAKYGEICDFIKIQNLKPVFDEETKSPYVTNGTEWVSYENDESMKYKTEHVMDNGFGGVMVFSLSSDDYSGRCKDNVTFPNTKMIYKIFMQ